MEQQAVSFYSFPPRGQIYLGIVDVEADLNLPLRGVFHRDHALQNLIGYRVRDIYPKCL